MTDFRTYLWNDTEVVLTGRTAERKIETSSRRRGTERVEFRYEIRPANIENGSWTAWVRKEDLFTINDTNLLN